MRGQTRMQPNLGCVPAVLTAWILFSLQAVAVSYIPDDWPQSDMPRIQYQEWIGLEYLKQG